MLHQVCDIFRNILHQVCTLLASLLSTVSQDFVATCLVAHDLLKSTRIWSNLSQSLNHLLYIQRYSRYQLISADQETVNIHTRDGSRERRRGKAISKKLLTGGWKSQKNVCYLSSKVFNLGILQNAQLFSAIPINFSAIFYQEMSFIAEHKHRRRQLGGALAGRAPPWIRPW